MGRGMSGHLDSCHMRLWSRSGLLRLEKSTHEICKKREAEEKAGMLWHVKSTMNRVLRRGKNTINRQLGGGGGGSHKSPAQAEAE
jgi:hypothetical protein